MPRYNDDPENLKTTTNGDHAVFWDPDGPEGAYIASDAAVDLDEVL